MVTKVMLNPVDQDGADLTDKQVQVLQFVRDRRTNKEIALMLGISPSAVEQRLQSVRRKFGVHSRADLARAYEKFLIPSAILTGAEYQVESSIPDGQTAHNFREEDTGPQTADEVSSSVAPEMVIAWGSKPDIKSPEIGLQKSKSTVLDNVDRTAGVAGRIAAIVTVAASFALLVILIVKIAPEIAG